MRPIVVAAGGTGGHFFPAEALAAALIARGHHVVLMTDARSGALNSDVFANREQFRLQGAGLAGRGVWRALRGAAGMFAGTLQARAILKKLDAAAVIGFGGYPSVPPVLAARTLRHRPRVILHEQNAVLGRANRFLSRYADGLALGVAATRLVPAGVAVQVTGNPVRPAITALAGSLYVSPNSSINLLVLGGSLGARVFSDVVPAAVASLPRSLRDQLKVTQQCRGDDLPRVAKAYRHAGVEADLSSFFADVAGKLSEAHLVIARAGASTCAELAVAGRPAILVPLPGAIDDHQTANAAALQNVGGGWVIAQREFSIALLTERLTTLLSSPMTLADAAESAALVAAPHAADSLADMVEQTIMAGAAT